METKTVGRWIEQLQTKEDALRDMAIRLEAVHERCTFLLQQDANDWERGRASAARDVLAILSGAPSDEALE